MEIPHPARARPPSSIINQQENENAHSPVNRLLRRRLLRAARCAIQAVDVHDCWRRRGCCSHSLRLLHGLTGVTCASIHDRPLHPLHPRPAAPAFSASHFACTRRARRSQFRVTCSPISTFCALHGLAAAVEASTTGGVGPSGSPVGRPRRQTTRHDHAPPSSLPVCQSASASASTSTGARRFPAANPTSRCQTRPTAYLQ